MGECVSLWCCVCLYRVVCGLLLCVVFACLSNYCDKYSRALLYLLSVCVCVTLTIYGNRLTLDHASVVDGLAVVGATVLIPHSLDLL